MPNAPENLPGHSARQIAKRRFRTAVLIALATIVLFLLCLSLLPYHYRGIGNLISAVILFLAVIKVVVSFADDKIRASRKMERKALRGAQAEEAVGALLEQLPQPRAVFHDVNTGHGDIDHVVLSPAHGLILIETKSHHGTVEVQGETLLVKGFPPEKDFIKQTVRNTMWLHQRIKETSGFEVWVNAILVFANAFVPRIPPVRGIRLVNKKYLLKTIADLRPDPAIASKLWAAHQQGQKLW